MADDPNTQRQLSNSIPVVRHPSTGSGDCVGLENAKLRAGATSDWTLDPAAFAAVNPPTQFWVDEVTEFFIVTEEGALIKLE